VISHACLLRWIRSSENRMICFAPGKAVLSRRIYASLHLSTKLRVVIAFTQGGADNPFISGIEIYAGTASLTPTPVTIPPPTGTVPAQFIAKQYTEGLGRAPDQASRASLVSYFQANSCSVSTVRNVGEQIYNSTEFASDYSDNAARVLALYRSALNRDPSQSELNTYVSEPGSGTSWSSVVSTLFSSAEFDTLVSSICNASAPNYHFGSQAPPALPTGSTGYTGSESGLQTALSSASLDSTVYLAQKALISITTTLTVPTGVTLLPGVGNDTLTASASDSVGNVATSAPVTISVSVQDPLPPATITLTSPVSSTVYNAPASILLTASISQPSNSIVSVSFYNGNTLLGTVTSAPYSFTWSNVAAGTYSLTATYIDTFNITETSAEVAVPVSNTLGLVTAIDAGGTATGNASLTSRSTGTRC
jgi:hypothetical protein